ncbi:MAG TPA: hypothetical protein DHV16_09290 [Nitrospiraceae bacterium]|nr:MAG: hypothetical protein A2Z82_00990 [Nitrospirae bacterium GWA2_46_11]HAK87584.1 hypothetical protein [Nitrospiraceae bacterium]HCZ12423.1 hypothetical protein [Nitrospiraceae bacterium]
MKELLSKLSSYNLFNYLLPGVIFVAVASKVTRYSFIQEDIVIGLFLYYFIGLVISRFGSIVIEPILRGVSFLKFADYNDFVAASKKDEKIEVLSEANNTYRTLCSLFILLLLLKGYERIEDRFVFLKDYGGMIVLALLLVMFLFAYRKQTLYIIKRIKANG